MYRFLYAKVFPKLKLVLENKMNAITAEEMSIRRPRIWNWRSSWMRCCGINPKDLIMDLLVVIMISCCQDV